MVEINLRLSCLFLLGLLACMSACTRANDSDNIRPLASWEEKFKEDKHIVLIAPWEKAENAYEDLSERVNTPDEMKQWIKFQIEILDETENDPLKDEIRMSAASHLKDYPNLVSPYVEHLKEGLSANRYKEASVRDWIKLAIEKAEQKEAKHAEASQ